MTDGTGVRDAIAGRPSSRRAAADGSLKSAVGAEFRRLFTSPRDEVMTVIGNGAAVCVVWLILPTDIRESMFALPGQLALAVVLASWMLGDTPATNMLAKDRATTVGLLDDRVRLLQLLQAKAAALACLVGPVCAAAAVAIGAYNQKYAVGAALAWTLLVVPLGTAAMAAWLGIVWPYHPQSLAWRWSNRRPTRRPLRWLSLVVAPYFFVPAL